MLGLVESTAYAMTVEVADGAGHTQRSPTVTFTTGPLPEDVAELLSTFWVSKPGVVAVGWILVLSKLMSPTSIPPSLP